MTAIRPHVAREHAASGKTNRAGVIPGPVTIESIVADAARGGISFPTSTLVAMRVVRAVNDPECSIEAAARLIGAEPLLASKVVALANSVAYNRSNRLTTDVRAAVATHRSHDGPIARNIRRRAADGGRGEAHPAAHRGAIVGTLRTRRSAVVRHCSTSHAAAS
jgi:hypothetical protein